MTKKYWVILFFLLGAGALFCAIELRMKAASFREDILCKDCNVVLITMTNLRFDHVSGNGYFRDTTPNIDALMKKGVVFENAFSHSSWTLPEAITMYTGLYPFEHTIMNRHLNLMLDHKTMTIVDALKSQGYVTALFSGGYDYDEQYGLTNRFDIHEKCTKNNEQDPGILDYGELSCSIPKAMEWLRQNDSKKFFMHVQGFDAHCPFNQKEHFFDVDYSGKIDFSGCIWTFGKEKPVYKNGKEYYSVLGSNGNASDKLLLDQRDIEHLKSIYDESIFRADEYIGQFLAEIDRLGLTNKTIIIFTSEHGDMFGKYGRFMRGGPLVGTFYDDVIHIPLVFRIPSIDHEEVNTLVSQIDLFPTIMSLLGIEISTRISGNSLVPNILGKTKGSEYIYAGSTFTPEDGNMFMSHPTKTLLIRNVEWKLIKTEMLEDGKIEYELFNLVNDPAELVDVKTTEQEAFELLRGKLDHWEKSFNF
ncbi:MAG: sulfatase [Candidatus Roizmanbacteria bacterium]|nr:sulfatase [Candidatus Roizmanbacteria bacterium]